MKHPLFAVILSFILLGQAPTDLRYRFDDVYGKVLIDRHQGSMRVRPGDSGNGGDVVRTGWMGRAVVSSAPAAARFEIHPGSRVILASQTPGVLVKLERGRLKALFDALTGDEERLVETPGALLAVRGTRYGVEVDRQDRSRLVVFEGAVEVRPFDRSMAPALVRAGEMCEYRHREQIRVRPMPRGMTEEGWGQPRGAGRPGSGVGDSPRQPAPGQDPGRGAQRNPDPPGRPH